jgi:hypothetical protein
MRARLSSSRDVFGPRFLRAARWLVLWMLWTIPGGAPGLRADIQEPNSAHAKGARQQRRPQPASGVPQSETIDQGATVEITLRSRGQIGKWIDFFIRTEPVHGSLSGPPRQVTHDTAVVTYVHHAEDGPGTDAFTYSVQAAGSAVSAPIPVTIVIRDTAPVLVATPAELDFGAVRVGDTSGADLVLENQGGGEAVGRLSLPPPWTVDGSADYRLARGERQSFHIVFGPRSGRSFSETLALFSDSGAPTHLLGTGLGPPGEPDALASAGGATRAEAAAPSDGGSAANGPEVAAVASSSGPVTAPPQLGARKGAGGADSLVKAGRSTLDISWKPLAPKPRSYRVELRYLAIDAQNKLRIDWRPYAQVDIHVGKDLCTATVRRLPPGTRQTLRVVAIDFSGRIAGGSATLQAATLPAANFWRVTPLRVLVALLLLCGALALRRRWEVRQMLREIDESRAASPDYQYRS